MNLLANAIDAIGDKKGKITISSKLFGNQIEISIKDTGEGMKEQVSEEVKTEVTKAIQEEIGDKIDVEKIADTEAVKEEVKSEIDTTKKEVENIAKSQADSLKQGILSGDTAKVENAVKDAQDKIKNLFKKKKKNN